MTSTSTRTSTQEVKRTTGKGESDGIVLGLVRKNKASATQTQTNAQTAARGTPFFGSLMDCLLSSCVILQALLRPHFESTGTKGVFWAANTRFLFPQNHLVTLFRLPFAPVFPAWNNTKCLNAWSAKAKPFVRVDC